MFKVLISLKLKLLFVSPSCWRSVYLIEKRMKGLNPPQRGLGMIGKSQRPRKKICVFIALLFNYLLISFPRI
jgi:hypothetical protein